MPQEFILALSSNCTIVPFPDTIKSGTEKSCENSNYFTVQCRAYGYLRECSEARKRQRQGPRKGHGGQDETSDQRHSNGSPSYEDPTSCDTLRHAVYCHRIWEIRT